jgi:NAD(P)H-flavin reductase
MTYKQGVVIVCRVLDMEEATSEVLLLKLAPANGMLPDSRPGQYIEVALPGGERIPLSVANRPYVEVQQDDDVQRPRP